MALRIWTIDRWTWEVDDWITMWRASTNGLGDYLLDVYNVHVLPGALMLTWVLTKVAPLDFTFAIALTTTMWAAAQVIWARAFTEIWGERRRLLVPLAVMSLTPLAVRPTQWWSAAMLIVPLVLSMAACVYFAARYARRPGWRPLTGVVVCFVLGLLCFEKSMLILVPVAATLLECSGLPPLAAARRFWRLLVALGIVVVAYVGTYVSLVVTAPEGQVVTQGPQPNLLTALGYYVDVLTGTIAPAVLGGPWGTTPTYDDPLVGADAVTKTLATLAVVALLVVGVRRRRRSWVPLVMIGSYVVLAYALVILSRGGAFGVLSVRQERYSLDVLAVVGLGAAMLLCPAPSAGDLRSVQAVSVRRLTSRLYVAAGAALAASLVVSNVLVVKRVGVHPYRAWVRNLTGDIERRGQVDLYDDGVPGRLTGAGSPVTLLSQMLSPLGDRALFDGPAAQLLVADRHGHLRPAAVIPSIRSMRGPVKDCGYAISSTSEQKITLTGELFPYRWGMDLTAFAGRASVLIVKIDDTTLQIPVDKGFAAHTLSFTGPVRSVRIALPAGSSPVCVTEIGFGEVRPSPARDAPSGGQ